MGKYIVAESNDLSMNLEMLAHFNTLYISREEIQSSLLVYLGSVFLLKGG